MDRIDNNPEDRHRQEPAAHGWSERLRSSGFFMLALGVHAAAATVFLTHWSDNANPVWSAPAITVDLAPTAAAPTTLPTELRAAPPSPQQDVQPTPVQETAIEKPAEKVEKILEAERSEEKIDVKPEPVERAEPTPEPLSRPVEKLKQDEPRKRHKVASLAARPSPAERHADRSIAPAPGASIQNSNAVPNWKSQLVARLEQYKRYPPEAQSRGDHGVVQLAFSIDRSGGVHGARILRSSGSNLLDGATLSLVKQAAPFPPPPAEMRGAQIAVVVPIRYDVR